jgi:predicted transcriptional regulator
MSGVEMRYLKPSIRERKVGGKIYYIKVVRIDKYIRNDMTEPFIRFDDRDTDAVLIVPKSADRQLLKKFFEEVLDILEKENESSRLELEPAERSRTESS